MSSYYNMDLTGTDPAYQRAGDIYVFSQAGDVIDFGRPVFLNSISVVTTDGNATPLVNGTDWAAEASDYDTTAKSRALTKDITFSAPLVKSITVLKTLGTKVSISYQCLYSQSPTSATEDNSSSVEFNPAAWSDVLGRLGVLEQDARTVADTSASTTAQPKLLPYDATGTASTNLVTGEAYTINTFGNQKTIRLAQGTFYRDSLVLTTSDGTYTLVDGTDYLPVCLNAGKTKAASNMSGAYDLIMVTYKYAGTLNAKYQAVGGSPSVSDIAAVYTNLEAIKTFLNSTSMISEDALPDTLPIKNIITRLSSVESNVRKLLLGNPTYGDTTTGISVVKYLHSADTAGLHWYTLATLYKVEGSTSLVTADRMRFRFHMTNAGMMGDVIVAFDADNPMKNMTVSTAGVLQNVSFVPYGASNAIAVVYPQFRVIWNNNAGVISGAILQIGLNIPTGSETIEIEDISGTESCWILDQTASTAAAALSFTDDNITLPDGTSKWSSSGTDSKVAVQMMPNADGYLVFEGTQAMSTFDTTAGQSWNVAHSLPTHFRVVDIKSLIVDIVDPKGPLGYRAEILMSSFSSTNRAGQVPVTLGAETLNLRATLSQDTNTGQITVLLALDNALPQGVTAVVRYITARV